MNADELGLKEDFLIFFFNLRSSASICGCFLPELFIPGAA